jgi:hypothetical protein
LRDNAKEKKKEIIVVSFDNRQVSVYTFKIILTLLESRYEESLPALVDNEHEVVMND